MTQIPQGELASRLLERDPELQAVAEALLKARGGAGRPILVEGPAGIGKTRLLQAIGERALLEGFEVRSARATELEREFPFGPVRQLFEPMLAALDDEARAEVVSGAAELGMAVFAPPRTATPPADPEYGHLHGLYWLAANLAERRPMLLIIDDLHWADRASLRFLSFLAPRLDGVRLLLVLSTRPGEPGANPVGVEISEHPDLEVIRPRPLSEGAVEELLRDSLGHRADQDLVKACHRATGGNPFLLTELLRDLGEHADPDSVRAEEIGEAGPDRIASSILKRLGRAGEDATALAQSIAVLGDRADPDHAAALSDLSPARVGDVADLLSAAGILQSGRPLRFAHPIMRTAVYGQMRHDQRATSHGRAARLLAETGGDEAAAVHLLSTDPIGDQWVVSCLQTAARTTLSRGEPGLANRFLERARAEPPDGDAEAEVLFELARAAGQAGEPDAIEDLRAAGELARTTRLKTLAATQLAMSLHFLDRGEESIDIAEAALYGIGDDEVELAPPLQAILLIGAHHRPSTRAKTLTVIHAAVEQAEAGNMNPVLLAHAAFELGVVDGDMDKAAVLARQAFEEGLIAAVTADFPSAYPPACILFLADRFDQSEHWLSSAIEEARSRGSGRGFAPASAFRAWSRYRRGDLAGAEADARASEEMLSSDHIIRPVAVGVLIRVLVDRGRLDEAVGLAEGFDPNSLRAGLFSLPLYYEAKACLELARSRHGKALAALEPITAWEGESGYRGDSWVSRRPLEAIARWGVGENQEAARLAEEGVALARELGPLSRIGIALRSQALAGAPEHRKRRLRESVEALADSGARLEHALALVDLGATIRRANQPLDARVPLKDGLELAHSCGATALVDRATEELVTAGGRPRRPEQTGVDALTPAERRVAELAAQGKSNRDIAQDLFVTRKTVETHLGSVYRKLDISSRLQLEGKLLA